MINVHSRLTLNRATFSTCPSFCPSRSQRPPRTPPPVATPPTSQRKPLTPHPSRRLSSAIPIPRADRTSSPFAVTRRSRTRCWGQARRTRFPISKPLGTRERWTAGSSSRASGGHSLGPGQRGPHPRPVVAGYSGGRHPHPALEPGRQRPLVRLRATLRRSLRDRKARRE